MKYVGMALTALVIGAAAMAAAKYLVPVVSSVVPGAK